MFTSCGQRSWSLSTFVWSGNVLIGSITALNFEGLEVHPGGWDEVAEGRVA